jgi:hypothetical protein
MEDLGPSLRCPECQYGLFTAAFLNVGFLRKSNCPYCGGPVRWAIAPLLTILFGLLISSTGLYALANQIVLPTPFENAPILALGAGICVAFIGLMFVRFVNVRDGKIAPRPPRTRNLYPNAS